MRNFLQRIVVSLLLLTAAGCTSGSGPKEATSPNSVLFDPTTGTIPLPNILATATAPDPFLNFSGQVMLRPAGRPMNPQEAIAYVNQREVGGTNAVAGVNAPIYLRFARPVDPSTVTAANIKVFQVGSDPSGLENNRLAFTDISTAFDFSYTPGSTDLFLFPKFPLNPATKYLYLVTNRVRDAATGGTVIGSVYFEALKSQQPLAGPFAPLEAIRDNVYTDASRTSIRLSGYAKTMNDLIASAASTVTALDQIALIGRFITTGAGFILTDTANQASAVPVESALRSFAAGQALGGLPGKNWNNAATVTAQPPPAAYFAQVLGAGASAPPTVAAVTLGTINSADLSMDPVLVRANPSAIDLSAVAGADNPAAGVLQPFRTGTALTGFYHVPRSIPFVYLSPVTPNGTLVIFQHGITREKEDVVGVAAALTGAGFAVVAIDLPLHGQLSPHPLVPGDTPQTVLQKQTQWGSDFLAVGAPLAGRTNVQQAAFNLDRLEFTAITGGFATFAGAPPARIKYLSMSLGSIVGAYYLAGNTTLAASPVPYTQATLNADMKGLLNAPGGRIAYLLKDSPTYGPEVNAGLAQRGVVAGTPTYNAFFQLTQSVIDPIDPATMTTPLAPGLPSRLSGRLLVQEATSTRFDVAGVPLNGDLSIPNFYTRYFGNALGGRGALGTPEALAVAPGFNQLSYASGRIPALFMFTTTGGNLAPKTAPAATSAAAAGPVEGYFQFDQSDVTHGFLIDPAAPESMALGQRQMIYFLRNNLVVDPTVVSAALPKMGAAAGALEAALLGRGGGLPFTPL